MSAITAQNSRKTDLTAICILCKIQFSTQENSVKAFSLKEWKALSNGFCENETKKLHIYNVFTWQGDPLSPNITVVDTPGFKVISYFLYIEHYMFLNSYYWKNYAMYK